jgi:hypothetical protein
MKAHASDELLEQYSLGTLPEPQAEPLEEHLLVCEQCQDRLNQTDAFIAAIQAAARKLRNEPNPGPAPKRSSTVLLLLTARPWRFLNTASAAPVAVMLQSARGPAGATAPAGRALILRIDLTELRPLDSYRLEIVDSRGDRVHEATVSPKNGDLIATVPARLVRGPHWVRLYTPAGDLLREFGLRIE